MLSSASDIVVEAALAEQIHLDQPERFDGVHVYCVTTMPFVARSSGVNHVSGRAEITVPQG